MKNIIVCGGGGFIGSHLVKILKEQGHWVCVCDVKYPDFSESPADRFVLGDLRNPEVCDSLFDRQIDEVFQLAADMGGAGYIFTGEHDAKVMHNSSLVNLNMVERCYKNNVNRVFYSSSACVYPEYNQLDPDNPNCTEDSAYPAAPDSEYGWEKLFSERLYLSYMRNHGLDVKIVRYHNIFGVEGTWDGGREKAPAALCRKVAEAKDGGTIEVWGDGLQTRSFLYIDECIEGSLILMNSDEHGPLNVGSDEMVSINNFAKMIIDISGKDITIDNKTGPLGVRGRNSDNRLIKEKLGWSPSKPLREGIEKTYKWIEEQVNNKK
jgi:GDP-D-mannose 3', 5'-epimerase